MSLREIAMACMLLAASHLTAPRSVQVDAQQVFDEVQQLFARADYELAQQKLNVLIAAGRSQADKGASAQVLVDALEMRGVARLALGNHAGATDDFMELFRLRPDHVTAHDGPRIHKALSEARLAVVGDVWLSVTPADAVARVGREQVMPNAPLALVAGPYEYHISRPGYTPMSGVIDVEAGATEELDLELDRTSAVVTVMTEPAGAEVWINGALRGVTTPRATSELHGAVDVDGLPLGEHLLEVRLQCYASRKVTFAVEKLSDMALPSVALEHGRSTIRVESNLPHASVFLNGQLHGRTPISIGDICEGRLEIDVRAAAGRFSQVLDVLPRSDQIVEAMLVPTVALVVAPREQAALPAATVGGILKSLTLDTGTLRLIGNPGPLSADARGALDTLHDWQGEPGPNAQHRRVEATKALAGAWGVQGIALVSRASESLASYNIEVFAAGSAQPDVFRWADDRTVIRQMVQALGSQERLIDYHLEGALLADVLTSGYPIFIPDREDHPLGGAFVERVDDHQLKTARSVYEYLAVKSTGEVLLALEDSSGQKTTVTWPVARRPRLLWFEDSTRQFNRLIPLYQFIAMTTTDPLEREIARLNQAIAYMAVKNWDAARVLLQSLQQSDVSPWPAGTIPLLLGKCFEAGNQVTEARKAWQAAFEGRGLLTEDGPDVSEQAKLWLASLDGRE
jgi:hypothetical protein